MRRYLPWVILPLLFAVVSALVSPDYVNTLADTGSRQVVTPIYRPTNVVTELSTQCSSSVQFGLLVNHGIIFDDEVVMLKQYVYEVDNEVSLCHCILTTPGYTLDGYFSDADTDCVFSLSANNVSSRPIQFVYLDDEPVDILLKDTMDYTQYLDTANTLLAISEDYWTHDAASSDFGTYYRVPLNTEVESLIMSYDADSVLTYVDIFLPSENNDTQTYKIRCTYSYQSSDNEVQQEYYEFQFLFDVGYNFNVPGSSVTTTNRESFDRLYSMIMR